ncbi:hypothetical protein [Galbibacter sp.]|uniref:hypothetical protein n=1 Tax=Galbibacter sp. TaxID=2918471 RepID=UPI003A8FD466
MFLRKVHSVLVAIILAFILANLSYEASTFQGNAEDAITDQTIQDSNLQSRNSIQFQFQAYTNIYSEFDVNTKIPNLIRPFQAVVKFTNPPLNTTSLKDNKELELSSIWAKNKTIQHLLPYHGFS